MLLNAGADKEREVAAGFGYTEVISDLGTGCLHGVVGPKLHWSEGGKEGRQ